MQQMTRWWSLGRSEICSLAGLTGAALGAIAASLPALSEPLAFGACIAGALLLGILAWVATRGWPEPRTTAVPAVVLLVALPVVGVSYLVGHLLGLTSGFTPAAFTWFLGAIVVTQIVGRLVSDLVSDKSASSRRES